MSTHEFLTPEQLAAELQIPVKTLYQWRYTGRGPAAHKIGKHLRYSRQAVTDWLNTQAGNDGEAA